MNEKSLRYRRSRLEKESSDLNYAFYFTTNYEKPFILIDGKTVQFKSRKSAADYGCAVYMIKEYQERNKKDPCETYSRMIKIQEKIRDEALKHEISTGGTMRRNQ